MEARACLLVLALAACGRGGFDVDDPVVPQCDLAAEEACNGVDDDCDLAVDEGCPCEEQMLEFPVGQSYWPAIAWSGSGYGIVWTEAAASGQAEPWFAYVDAAGATPPIRLPGPRPSEVSDIAWTGERFLVVWREFGSPGTSTIKSIGVQPDGTLDGAPNVIGAPGQDPRLIRLGNGHAVVYSTGFRQLRLAAIDRRGALVRSSAITGLDDFFALRTASSATQFGVIWTADQSSYSPLSFQAFDVEGAALGEPLTVATDTYLLGHAIASAGDAYAILWTEPVDMNRNLFFARADAGGLIGSPIPIVTNTQIGPAQADLIWTGEHFIGVWGYYDAPTSEYRTVLAYLDASGARLVPDRHVKSTLFTVPHPRLAIADGRIGLVWAVSSDGDTLAYLRFAQFCD